MADEVYDGAIGIDLGMQTIALKFREMLTHNVQALHTHVRNVVDLI